jgi:hypothetical protein
MVLMVSVQVIAFGMGAGSCSAAMIRAVATVLQLYSLGPPWNIFTYIFIYICIYIYII